MSRNEIKEKHLNSLQEKYNNLLKDCLLLQKKYDKLSHIAIETVFSNMNDDVELLARCLYKQGKISRTETEWINPLNENESSNAIFIKIKEINNE
jgi:hypothetical protein